MVVGCGVWKVKKDQVLTQKVECYRLVTDPELDKYDLILINEYLSNVRSQIQFWFAHALDCVKLNKIFMMHADCRWFASMKIFLWKNIQVSKLNYHNWLIYTSQ